MRRLLLAFVLTTAGIGLSGCWHDGAHGWGDHGGHHGGGHGDHGGDNDHGHGY